MTLQDYIKVFRHRWMVIVICALVAAAVTWLITPASADFSNQISTASSESAQRALR